MLFSCSPETTQHTHDTSTSTRTQELREGCIRGKVSTISLWFLPTTIIILCLESTAGFSGIYSGLGKVVLPIAGDLEWDDPRCPFQPKPVCSSVILCAEQIIFSTSQLCLTVHLMKCLWDSWSGWHCLQPQSGMPNDLCLPRQRSLLSKAGNGIDIFHYISGLIQMVGQMTE